VRYSPEGGRLTCGEGLLEGLPAVATEQTRDVHLVCGVFVRPAEEYLWMGQFGLHSLLGSHDVDESIHVGQEGFPIHVVLAVLDTYDTLGPALGDILVLELLCEGQLLVLLKVVVAVVVIGLVVGLDDPDAPSGDVPEPDVEASEVVTLHKLDALGHFGLHTLVQQQFGIQSLHVAAPVGDLHVGGQDGAVKVLHLLENVALTHVGDAFDLLQKFGVLHTVCTCNSLLKVGLQPLGQLEVGDHEVLHAVLLWPLDDLVSECVNGLLLPTILAQLLVQFMERGLLVGEEVVGDVGCCDHLLHLVDADVAPDGQG